MLLRNASAAFWMLLPCMALATSAHGGTVLYEASLVIHAFSGGTPLPIGGVATGSGTLGPTSSGTSPAAVALPQSAVAVTTAAYWPIYPPDTFYSTYAKFANAAGGFYAGGGPAAGKGTVSHKGRGRRVGSWFIREGKNAFGGTLGLFGKLGAFAHFRIKPSPACFPGRGIFSGTSSWNLIRALGRSQADTLNPYTNTGMFVNKTCGLSPQTSVFITSTKIGSGTAWTTGTVTVIATQGDFATSLRRTGYDTTTPGGVRNIQLVTPALTHWTQNPGSYSDHTGHIAILKIRLAPEPAGLAMIAAGACALLLLGRRAHSSSSRRDFNA